MSGIRWVVINWGIALGLMSVLALILVILSISLPGLIKYSDDEMQNQIFDEIDDDKKIMCGMHDDLDAIFDSIDLISSESLDNKSKGIYQQIQWGKDIESCDVVYLYDNLSFEQKKKLDWLDFSCNVPQCKSG